MNRLDAMRDRLPPIWGHEDGTLTHALLALIAAWQAAYDEDMDRVQRSHWVDTAFDFEDLAKLGALFDVAPAPWETTGLYRTRLKATIAARLRGAVSRDVLEFVLVAILGGAQTALGSRYFDLPVTAGRGVPVFHTGPTDRVDEAAFIEFPLRRRRSSDLLDNGALRRPLATATLTNRGLFPADLQGVVRGVAGRRTAVPVIANLTNNQVMAYVGVLSCGEALRIGVAADGTFTADHAGRDVSDRFLTAGDFVPGARFAPVVPDPTPQPLRLERGENRLWFFPLALYDEPTLGTGVFAMPETDIRHGRWAGKGESAGSSEQATPFDRSLFEQPPAVSLDLFWDEAAPASFRFELPAGVVRREAGADTDAETERERLFSLLQDTVSLLRAAGVDGRVEARPLASTQRQHDRVQVLDPTQLAEQQPMLSRLAGLSALFDVSAIDDARFE